MERERKESDLSALQEARSLVRAMQNGLDVRDAIAISPDALEKLNAFCDEYPSDAYIVRNALAYRDKVKEYIVRLLKGENVTAEAKDGEEVESEEVELAESTPPEASGWSSPDATGYSIPEAEA